MRPATTLLPLICTLAACTVPQPTDAPPDSIPRFDVAISAPMSVGQVSTGILLPDRLVLTAAHTGVLDADVMVVGDHATYVEQIVGLPPTIALRCLNDASAAELPASADWALVRLADELTTGFNCAHGPARVAERPARIRLDASPPPGTEVLLVGWIRDERASTSGPSALPQRRAIAGTVIARPRNADEGDEAIFIRTAHRRLKGFSGGPVLAQDDNGEWAVIAMTVIEWQPFLRRNYTTVIALRITSEMIVPSIDGRRLVVLGRRDRLDESGADTE